MPLACLAAVAGGVSCGPAVRVGFAVSSRHATLGHSARRFLLPAAWFLGIASSDPVDAPASILRFATRWRWLAVMESGAGMAAGAIAPGQPGIAIDGGAAFSPAG